MLFLPKFSFDLKNKLINDYVYNLPWYKVKELLNLGTLKFTNTSMHKTFLISFHLCEKNPCDLIESHFTQRDDKALWVRTIHSF